MKLERMLEKARALAGPFRVTDGESFRLRDYNSDYTLNFKKNERKSGKRKAAKLLKLALRMMREQHEKLYAEGKQGLVIIFQALDAGGKDSAIKHVMSGVNPQGCQVHPFKAPSAEELGWDFLRRCAMHLPKRGQIGIFNRSYYEETLVVRVHPEILAGQKLPASVISNKIWKQRFQDIRAFERYLTHQGFTVIKFFLNVSKKEQKRRFLDRIEIPKKNWKFSASDIHERCFWNKYQKSFEDMIRHTAHKRAPWYVVPADRKWFTRLIVASVIIDTLRRMNPEYPEVDAKGRKALLAAFHGDGRKKK